MRVKYIGENNGLVIIGKHFPKNKVVEVSKIEYEKIMSIYSDYFDVSVNGGRPKQVKEPVIDEVSDDDEGIEQQLEAEKLGYLDDEEENKEEKEELIGDVDGDGDVDFQDIVKVVKNVGKRKKKNKGKK